MRRKSQLQTIRYKEILQWVRELKSENGCVDCGVTDYRVLQFDHLPEHEKAISIADGLRNGYSKSKLKEEMAKCEIVCANCHSIRTFERRKRT